jgi:hypothetical protein
VELWGNLYSTPSLPADVEYPVTGIQTFQLNSAAFNTSAKEEIMFYSYGTTVPTSLPFPPSQAYTIHSNQQDSFTVTFSSVKPSAYSTSWTAGNISFSTIAPPDSTVLHPYTLLAGSGSKLLQGQSFGPLTLQNFYWQQVAGMNYAQDLTYFCAPADFPTQRISAITTYALFF